SELRRTLLQMLQGLALHINERLLPREVHHFEAEPMSVPACQVEIVVVFTRQCPCRSLDPVKFARQTNRFRFRYRMSYARLQQHAPNLICNSRSASIPQGSNTLSSLPSTRSNCPLQLFSRLLNGNWPIHRGQPDRCRPGAIFNAAVLVVPRLAGVIANARLAAYRRV